MAALTGFSDTPPCIFEAYVPAMHSSVVAQARKLIDPFKLRYKKRGPLTLIWESLHILLNGHRSKRAVRHFAENFSCEIVSAESTQNLLDIGVRNCKEDSDESF